MFFQFIQMCYSVSRQVTPSRLTSMRTEGQADAERIRGQSRVSVTIEVRIDPSRWDANASSPRRRTIRADHLPELPSGRSKGPTPLAECVVPFGSIRQHLPWTVRRRAYRLRAKFHALSRLSCIVNLPLRTIAVVHSARRAFRGGR